MAVAAPTAEQFAAMQAKLAERDKEVAALKANEEAQAAQVAALKAKIASLEDVTAHAVMAARAVATEAVTAAVAVSASGYAQNVWVEHQGLEFNEHGVAKPSKKKPRAAYLCGRPHSASAPLPAALVCDGFVTFLDTWYGVDDAAIPVDLLSAAHDLCVLMCSAYKEEAHREAAAQPVLSRALRRTVESTKGKAPTDGTVLSVTGDFKHMLLNLEVKNLLTAARGDAYMQNVQYFTKFNQKVLAAFLPAPAFLVTIVDNVLTVSGAYFDVQPCCQPLISPVWLMHAPGTIDGELAVARVLYALRCGIDALETWYKGQEPAATAPQRVVRKRAAMKSTKKSADVEVSTAAKESAVEDVTRRSYALPMMPSLESGAVRLTNYLIPERRSTLLFRGMYTRRNGTELPVAVKFVQRYGVEAHSAAALRGLAPEIYEVAEFHHGWAVIVMEILDVPTWTTLRSLIDNTSPALKDRGKKAARLLLKQFKAFQASGSKSKPFVHGDMHQKNVLVTTSGEVQVRVVDWDWSSKQDAPDAVYPPFINRISHTWAPGVAPAARMFPAHDIYLIKHAILGNVDVTPPASPDKTITGIAANREVAVDDSAVTVAVPRAGTKRRRD